MTARVVTTGEAARLLKVPYHRLFRVLTVDLPVGERPPLIGGRYMLTSEDLHRLRSLLEARQGRVGRPRTDEAKAVRR